LAVTHVALP
jgi:hypothetical protein